MTPVYLISAVRTPIGKFLGGLSEMAAPQLGAIVLKETLKRANLEPNTIDEVIMGQVVQAGSGQNPARQAALKAGLPETIAAFTINKVCGSGLKAAMLGAQAIKAGDADLILAGGMESMSRAPHLIEQSRTGYKYGDGKLVDALIKDGLWCAFENWPMGEAAEYTAQTCGITRLDQDTFSAQSHKKASQAWESGAFQQEVIPVTVGTGNKAKTIERDEGFRPETTPETLGKLRPAFQPEGGTVTAGNASQLSDGAAAVLLASENAVKKYRLTPLARVVAYATSGVSPKAIFTAPVSAVRMVLEKSRWTLSEVDLFELNEAFAAQMLACSRQLELDDNKVNVHGGGVALGHPIGASGARVLVTLIHALKLRNVKKGCASLCLGGGNAVAMTIESV